jgi:HEAT repeat protein
MQNDKSEDVRWNAAFALARLGDDGGVDLLMKLLDPVFVNNIAEKTAGQKAELRANAVTALGILRHEPAREKIAALSQQDPDLAVRNASLEALKKF